MWSLWSGTVEVASAAGGLPTALNILLTSLVGLAATIALVDAQD